MRKKTPAKKTAARPPSAAAAAVAAVVSQTTPPGSRTRKAKAAPAPAPRSAVLASALVRRGPGRPPRSDEPTAPAPRSAVLASALVQRRPGRPPRSDEPTASVIVRMPASVMASAREYAASQRRTLNAVFLDGLARELSESGRPLPPLLTHPDSAATDGI